MTHKMIVDLILAEFKPSHTDFLTQSEKAAAQELDRMSADLSRINFLTAYERDTGKVITNPSERAAALALDKLIAALKGES